jgi:hypothetical protein
MAHAGYVAIGLENLYGGSSELPISHSVELVNTNRAVHYASNAGLGWLGDCSVCPDIDAVIPHGTYDSVTTDPAPWYDPQVPDSWGFFGVVGVEMTGVDDSTRSAKVTRTLRGGGMVGVTYREPRTIILRALAVAASDCSLSYGLRWLNEQFMGESCLEEPLVFFDCCPDANCDEGYDFPVGPCWPNTYAELRDGPSCDVDWWPTTYYDLKAGPPYLRSTPVGATGDWCDWAGTYRELRTWLPPWNCCYELNVIPRMREFQGSQVTEGPTVLQRPQMTSGAMAEIEFTIVAGNPVNGRATFYWGDIFYTGTSGPETSAVAEAC